MKVLLVNISLDAERGGGTAERTRHLATHLAKAGASCEVMGMNGNSWQSEFDGLGVKTYITGHLGNRFPLPLLNPWRAWRAVRNADVIHIMGYWNLLSVAIGLLALIGRRPYVLCPAGEFASVGSPRPVMKIFHFFLGRWLIKAASGFIAITQLERQIIARVSGVPLDSVVVIENAVSEPQARLPSRTLNIPEEPYILFMGRLAPVKGPDFLIGAYLSTPLAQQFPLVMAGPDFGMQADLQERVRLSGLTDKIRFLGFMNEQERTQVYRGAMLLVIPSRSEAMSLVALEAGMLGVPVLLTDNCGFEQVASVDGGLVVPASEEGIANGLQQLLVDPAELKQKGQRLKDFVMKNYTWKAAVRAMLQRFDRLIRTGSMAG
ncbi:glycosyltransferase family 4 protein [Pseudomonas sp.]|uniref:glycosyltransferase family 4 protein n=1 Tax=Pseudomonas sp. TaxID=306 RepID=UPI0028AFAA49|nr:glycosyltransferase family 4 protein [Pseudomonas sp.]